MHVKHKASKGAPLLLKADDTAGVVHVAFAQLGVVDHDRDVTAPGAFLPGEKVKMCQTGHAHGVLPAGAGHIVGEQEIDGATWAVAEMKFFLDTPQGEATYKTVKALHDAGHTQEWSYGYDILAAEPGTVDGERVQILKQLHVYEISPVLRGAGIGTHTLAVKGKACEACGAVKDAEDPSPIEDVEVPAGDAGDASDVDEDTEAAAAKARQADALHLSWLSMKARHLTRPHGR